MDIVTGSEDSQQLTLPVLQSGPPPPPGRAWALARRGRARTEREMARANILNYLWSGETVWKVELRFVRLQNLSAALHLLYIFKAAK